MIRANVASRVTRCSLVMNIRRMWNMVIGLIGLSILYLLYLLILWPNTKDEEIDSDQVVVIRSSYHNPCSKAVIDKGIQLTRTCITRLPEGPILTAECIDRLGNQMFSYAILYAISLYNHRTAYMMPLMSTYISKYFKISMDTMDEDIYRYTKWSYHKLEAKVPENIKNLPAEYPYIKFCCYPQAWKYFDEIRPQILHEFRFQDYVEEIAEIELTVVRKEFSKSPGPFVGVHVRRTDYLHLEKKTKFNLPSTKYYKGAMTYFKSRFTNPIFIVASDDIPWCRENFASFVAEGFAIHYIAGTSQEDGGLDMAVLVKCDHVIFGMGTFGFWAGYLSPGEVVYCSDCLKSDSTWLIDSEVYGGDYANFVLPSWKGMPRNGGVLN